MHYEIRQAWLSGRWHVYELGHTEGDRYWVASFRFESHAKDWCNRHKPKVI